MGGWRGESMPDIDVVEVWEKGEEIRQLSRGTIQVGQDDGP